MGSSPEDLANGALTLQYTPGGTQGDVAAGDPNGPATDAIGGERLQPGEPCRHSEGDAVGGYTRPSAPLQSTQTTSASGSCGFPIQANGSGKGWHFWGLTGLTTV